VEKKNLNHLLVCDKLLSKGSFLANLTWNLEVISDPCWLQLTLV
jgi:hypothetical protein